MARATITFTDDGDEVDIHFVFDAHTEGHTEGHSAAQKLAAELLDLIAARTNGKLEMKRSEEPQEKP